MASRGLEAYRQQVRDQKRADILEAARGLFLQRGVQPVTMIEVADAAKVSTATLYKHFGSKEVLFRALTDALFEESEARAPAGATKRAAGLPQLEGVLLRLVEPDPDGDERLTLLRLLISEPELATVAATDVSRRIREHERAIVRREIDALVASGLLIRHDTARSATQLLGMVKEALFWPRFFEAGADLPDAASYVAACVRVLETTYGNSQRSPAAK